LENSRLQILSISLPRKDLITELILTQHVSNVKRYYQKARIGSESRCLPIFAADYPQPRSTVDFQ
jgi:hypothetical protein